MGCVAGKLDINDVHPNMFTVLNVDEMGSRVSPGQIEITEQDLVLYQKGKDPLKWPFKALRRYGFESEMFSFESGRRCPTGPGIYAFKCRRAENLFNLLQSRIRAGDTLERGDGSATVTQPDEPATPTQTSPPIGLGTPTHLTAVGHAPFTLPRPSTQSRLNSSLPRASLTSSRISETGRPISPEIQMDEFASLPLYVNCDISLPRPHTLPPINLAPVVGGGRVPPLHPDLLSPEILEAPSHEYENIVSGDPASPGYRFSRTSFSIPPPRPASIASQDPWSFTQDQRTSSLPWRRSVISLQTPGQSPPTQGPMGGELELSSGGPLNYILLDLQTQQTAHQNTTDRSYVGYTTIDFDKTTALIKSANQRFEDDEPGLRKTRHNSSISDISTVYKNPLSPID